MICCCLLPEISALARPLTAMNMYVFPSLNFSVRFADRKADPRSKRALLKLI